MKEILQNSDFRMQISFIDLCNKPINVKSFKFEYKTQMSNSYIVSFDGLNYTNCKPIEGGIVAIFNKPSFNVGQLFVNRAYTLESAGFEGGVAQFQQTDAISYCIVKSYSGKKDEKITFIPTSKGGTLNLLT